MAERFPRGRQLVGALWAAALFVLGRGSGLNAGKNLTGDVRTVHADARSLGRSWGEAALWQDVITGAGIVNSFSSRREAQAFHADGGGLLCNLSTQPSPTVSPASPQTALEWKIIPKSYCRR